MSDTVPTRASYDEVNNNIIDNLATFVAIVFSVLVVNVLDSNNCFSVILFDNRWRPAMDAFDYLRWTMDTLRLLRCRAKRRNTPAYLCGIGWGRMSKRERDPDTAARYLFCFGPATQGYCY